MSLKGEQTTLETPAAAVPVKRSRLNSQKMWQGKPKTQFSSSRGSAARPENHEDVEALADRHDTGLAAILSNIIERDTTNKNFVTPIVSKQAFPAVLHVSRTQKDQPQAQAVTKRRSLFAQQVDACSTRAFGVEPDTKKYKIGVSQSAGATVEPSTHKTDVSQSPTTHKIGMSQSAGATASEACLADQPESLVTSDQPQSRSIHQENMDVLSAMSEREILEEQRKLLQTLDPKLVEFLRRKGSGREELNKPRSGSTAEQSFQDIKGTHKSPSSLAVTTHMSTSSSSSLTGTSQKSTLASACEESFLIYSKEMKEEQTSQVETGLPEDVLSCVTPSDTWLHMDTVETEKLEWTQDLPPPPSLSSQVGGLPARFDFHGNLVAVDADIPVNLGLHHHGEEPERAGYTLQEIFMLVRSSNLQQRNLALRTLARIIDQTKCGRHSNKLQTALLPALVAGGVVLLLRWALDHSGRTTIAAAVDALHALLCSQCDEDAIDATWAWHQGHLLVALTPVGTIEKQAKAEDLDEENKEEETDADVMKRDVIEALVVRMELLVRLRYIFQCLKPQLTTVIQMLAVLSRVAQHSSRMAYEILRCPGLMETVITDFLPTAWTLTESGKSASLPYGFPVAAAMRFIRVLCQAGRNIASDVVSKFHLDIILLRYLASQSSDLQLPDMEATALQAESLSVWRVCAAYGLTEQTYFDMYSCILLRLRKLEHNWQSLVAGTTAEHKPAAMFDVRLLCVLERFLSLAASQHQLSRGTLAFPYVNWSHVTALLGPVKSCTLQILSDLAVHYPAKKQNLSLPTACLNFLSTYWELEVRQNVTDEVSSLESIEKFSNSCLTCLWTSFGLSLMTENLSHYSNLLAAASAVSTEMTASLPSLGVCQVFADNDVMSTNCDSCWRINMPILLNDSCFGFLVALLKLMLTICRRHKALIPQLMGFAATRKDIHTYMRKVCSTDTPVFTGTYFTRTENLLHYYWIKCCALLSYESSSLDQVTRTLAHRVALRLVARACRGDEHMVHDLMSSVVFSPEFLSEGHDMNLASQTIESLKLSQNLHLISATKEEITISKYQLLRDAFSALAKVRGHFLLVWRGQENIICKSRNQFIGDTQQTQSLFLEGSGGSILSRDWMYMPLVHIYNKAAQLKLVTGGHNETHTAAVVSSVLQWSYMLEVWRPAEMGQVSVTVRLTRVMCAFIAGNDLFLEKTVNQFLAGLLHVYTSQKLLSQLDFTENIPGLISFYDLYQQFLDHYEAVSFGDSVFGLYVLLPLQQKHSSMYRKSVWGERRKLLRTLRLPFSEMLIPIDNYLQPPEEDLELLQLYLSSLLIKTVQSSWSPVMYLIAVHHVNSFIFTSCLDQNMASRTAFWKQILAREQQMSDVIYYKQVNLNLPRGIELYETLPESRQKTMHKQCRN